MPRPRRFLAQAIADCGSDYPVTTTIQIPAGYLDVLDELSKTAGLRKRYIWLAGLYKLLAHYPSVLKKFENPMWFDDAVQRAETAFGFILGLDPKTPECDKCQRTKLALIAFLAERYGTKLAEPPPPAPESWLDQFPPHEDDPASDEGIRGTEAW